VWDGIAYGVMAIGLILAILFVTHYPITLSGAKMPDGKTPDVTLRRDPLSIFIVFLYVISFVLTFMWLLVDIVDRRRRFTWFVPLVVCGTFGFNVLPLAFYFFVGRKFESDGVSKS
jgi:hypothetical protein